MSQSKGAVGWWVAGIVLQSLVLGVSQNASASFDLKVQPQACVKSGPKMRGPSAAAAVPETASGGSCDAGEVTEPAEEKTADTAPEASPRDTKLQEKSLGAKSPTGNGQKPAVEGPGRLRGEIMVEGYLGSSYVYGTLSSSKQGAFEGYLNRRDGEQFYVYGYPETSNKGRFSAYDGFGNYITLQLVTPK